MMNGYERLALTTGCSVMALVLLSSAAAAAAGETAPSQDAPTQALTVHRRHRITGIHLDLQSGWSLALEGYAGLTTYSTSERTKGHAITGGWSRLRWQYFQFGAGVEASDYADERWRSLGGFIGAYLPFTNWVDLDVTVGLASRNYVSSDTRYGPSGASVKIPALTLRLGLSDRPLERLISPRLGAALIFGFDLKPRDVNWKFEVPGMEPIVGTNRFGGFTAGLVMSFGLDLGFRDDR